MKVNLQNSLDISAISNTFMGSESASYSPNTKRKVKEIVLKRKKHPENLALTLRVNDSPTPHLNDLNLNYMHDDVKAKTFVGGGAIMTPVA